MKCVLETASGSGAARKVVIASGKPVRIGRTDKADHSFPDDKQMSGLHFAVELTEKGCRLVDLNSSNGTFLNGARVKEATLANGDQIRAGATVFVLRILRDETLTPSQPARPGPEGDTLESPRGGSRPAQPGLQSRRTQETGQAAKPGSPPAAPSRSFGDLPSFSSRNAPLKPGELPSFPVAAPRISFPDAPPAPPLPPPAPRLPRLQDLFARDLQPLFALLDASREPSVLKVIYESKEEFQSLFEGAQGQQLAHFAPYLVRVPQKSSLVETLAKQAWSKSWGVFVTCDLPLKELRTHFRHFLNVKLPDGKQVYFRYYDPRVLRLFLPTCLPEETSQFFGPVKQFLMEAEDPSTALHFTRGPKGVAQKELHLAPA